MSGYWYRPDTGQHTVSIRKKYPLEPRVTASEIALLFTDWPLTTCFWPLDPILTTGIARDTDTLWSSSEIFFTRHLTEFMIKMLLGNKKYVFSKDQLYARAYVRIRTLRPCQLINGTVSVLFKKRCQSVLCVISEYFLFVCLFVCFYTVSSKVLKVHFWWRFSNFVISTGDTAELVVCLSLLNRPKTKSFCK